MLGQVGAQGFYAKIPRHDFPAVGRRMLHVPLVCREPDNDERAVCQAKAGAAPKAIQAHAELGCQMFPIDPTHSGRWDLVGWNVVGLDAISLHESLGQATCHFGFSLGSSICWNESAQESDLSQSVFKSHRRLYH